MTTTSTKEQLRFCLRKTKILLIAAGHAWPAYAGRMMSRGTIKLKRLYKTTCLTNNKPNICFLNKGCRSLIEWTILKCIKIKSKK